MKASHESILKHLPACPYVPGWTKQVRKHTPPPPFDTGSYKFKPEQYFYPGRTLDLIGLSRMEAVLTSPSLNQVPEGKTTHTISITKVIVGGPLNGPQVVVCSVQPASREPLFTAVAKIYDPLYYRLCEVASDSENEASTETIIDPARDADGEYAREAAAYNQISKHDTHGCTARYYGSYTFDLDAKHENVPGVTTRQVRLILIEYLDGVTMQELRKVPNMPNKFDDSMWQELDEEYRMAVWARFLEAGARLRHTGVLTNDDYPRNRMIVPPPPQECRTSLQQAYSSQLDLPKASSIPRVVIIDFGLSLVWPRCEEENAQSDHLEYQNELPTNPLIRQWNRACLLDNFRGWLPDWYLTNHTRRQEWLMENFIRNGKGKDYMHVEQVLEPGKKLNH